MNYFNINLISDSRYSSSIRFNIHLGSTGKKCSLSVAAADITIDMASPGNERSGGGGASESIMLAKKSPMHKLARLARLAGTSIGKDAMNSAGNTNVNCIIGYFSHKNIFGKDEIKRYI